MRRLTLVALVLVAAAYAAWNYAQPWFGTPVTPRSVSREVLIPQGASLAEAAERMEAAGVVTSARQFRLLARVLGDPAPIQAGEYRFYVDFGWGAHLRQMQRGDVLRRFVTIPEGLPSVMVADRLATAPFLTGPVPPLAEGSVLPDTYAYQRGETRAAVARRMTAAMDRALADLWPTRTARAAVRTKAEAVNLAAIVEKETAVPAERRRVAGVYTNRLRIGMKLDADPTVIYPVTRGRPLGRPIRRSELRADHGWNTYVRPGLPATPIANPGRASIAAVLDPEPHEFLYFVADGRGGHVFARTLAEHERNVVRWRAIRAARGS